VKTSWFNATVMLSKLVRNELGRNHSQADRVDRIARQAINSVENAVRLAKAGEDANGFEHGPMAHKPQHD